MTEKLDITCTHCMGYGIIQSSAERGGAFIECMHCKGTGHEEYRYEPFVERLISDVCERVYASSTIYVNTGLDITTPDGSVLPFSNAGCSYADWLVGKKPSPITFLGCPLFEEQVACHELDGFVDECYFINDGTVGYIPDCKGQLDTERCWKRFKLRSKK